MKTANNRLLVVAVAIAIVGLCWLLLQGRAGAPVTGATAAKDRLRWIEGNAQAYDIKLDSSFMMTLPGASAGQAMNVSLEAVMQFTTLRIEPGQVVAGARLSPVTMSVNGVTDAGVNRGLAQPFRVLFRPDGETVGFEFPAEIEAEHRQIIENLVRMFQVTVQEGDSWLVQEVNASGAYEARYQRSSANLLLKEKLRYFSSAPGAAAPVSKVSSTESIELDENTDWIVAMTMDETVSINSPGAPPVEISNLASISLQPGATPASVSQWDFAATQQPAVSAETQRAPLPDLTPEEALQQIETSVATLDAAVDSRSILIHRLRDLALIDDTLPFELLEIMNSQELTDRTRADLYLVLELVGTPESQRALASVLLDESWSPMDAMRAIVALGGVTEPTPDTLSVLWDIALSGATYGERRDLPSTAALALGSIGNTMLLQEDGSYTSLRAGLQAGAQSAASPHQQSAYLHALGNTGDRDPVLRNDIAEYLTDPAAEVRSAAAQTLGRLGADPVAERLLESFEQEPNGVVRGSIAGALAAWETPSPRAMAVARTSIQAEPDEKTRYNLAVLLANNLEQYPENRPVLQELLRTEKSKRIRQHAADSLY